MTTVTTMPHLALPAKLTFAQAKACSEQLKKALQAGLQQGQVQQIEVDASQVTQFDSSALAVLLQLRRDAISLQCEGIIVKNMSPKLRELVKLYGVAMLLPDA